MNFFNSVITSLLIVALIWTLALFQSPIAKAVGLKGIETKQQIAAVSNSNVPKTPTKAVKPATKAKEEAKETDNTLHISGLTKRISLNEIDQLWTNFNEKESLHQSLKRTPEKVYVLYRDLDDRYQQATVTIGYSVDELSKFTHHTSVSQQSFGTLLTKNLYSAEQLANGWKKINYSKAVNGVLEVHQLDGQGNTLSSQMLVSYK